jgi:hypothetical protein
MYYIGTRNLSAGAKLFRTRDFGVIETVIDDGFGKYENQDIYGLCEHRNQLYVGAFNRQGAEIYRTTEGSAFQLILDSGGDDPLNIDFFSFASWNGSIYTGTCNLRINESLAFDFANGEKFIDLSKGIRGRRFIQHFLLNQNLFEASKYLEIVYLRRLAASNNHGAY